MNNFHENNINANWIYFPYAKADYKRKMIFFNCKVHSFSPLCNFIFKQLKK